MAKNASQLAPIPLRTAAESSLAEAFAKLRGSLSAGAMTARREAAFRRFEAQGLPHRHVEEWKYTDLRALMREAKPVAGPADTAAKARAATAGAMFGAVGARRIVMVDGALVAELCDFAELEPGLKISSLAVALGAGELPDRFAPSAPAPSALTGSTVLSGPADSDIAYALNTAFMGDGAIIEVAEGARIERPLHLVYVYGAGRPEAVFSRSLVNLGAGAALTLIESHEGPDGLDYQVNAALDISIGDGARLDRVKLNAEGAAALHIATVNASIGADAAYSDFTFTTGGGVVRNQLFVQCTSAGSTLNLNGASLLRGHQHADTSLMVDHAAKGCRSRELFKSVLDEASRGIFQGKIIVRPGAQKTDARMMTRALLLSEDAEADNKPELEIFADDVQCGHGATSGALDDNLKFYLMARGIPEPQAEALLIESFIAEAVETVAHAGIREALMRAALQWLEARHQAQPAAEPAKRRS
jgi:Fe-S cluster assembly protein SufD